METYIRRIEWQVSTVICKICRRQGGRRKCQNTLPVRSTATLNMNTYYKIHKLN